MTHYQRQRCSAKSGRTGQPCQQWAIRGGTVCVTHGGRAPQVKAAAEQRLKAMVHPALDELEQLLHTADSDSVRLSAIKDVLDRAGYSVKQLLQIEQAGTVGVRVEYTNDWRAISSDSLALPAPWSADDPPTSAPHELARRGSALAENDDGDEHRG